MPFGQSILVPGGFGILAGESAPATKFAIQTAIGNRFADLPVAAVYTKATWGDAWVLRSDLRVARLSMAAGGSMGQATLIWHYGEIRRPGGAWDQVDPLDLRRHWVRIVFTPQTGNGNVEWYGVVVHDQRQRIGSTSGKHAGDQVFSCAAIEWCLSRIQVTTSEIMKAGGDTFTINRALAFNSDADNVQHRDRTKGGGNRALSKTAGDYYAFSDDPVDAARWTAADIVKYLINTQQPFEGGGPTIELHPDYENVLGWYSPSNVAAHGRTIFEVINQVCSERFGVTWSMEYWPPTGVFRLWFHSFAPSDVTLPDGSVFPKNINPIDVDYDAASDITRSLEIYDSSTKYQQVIAEGDYRGCVFTLSSIDENLVQSWTPADQTEYYDAAKDTFGYLGLSLDDQQARNDTFRASDRMRKVFTSFRVPVGWDGFTKNPAAAAPDVPVGEITSGAAFPIFDENGDIDQDESITFWVEGLRFQATLPLLDRHDYSTDPADPSPDSDLVSIPGFRKPTCWWRTDADNDKWIDTARMSTLSEVTAIDALGRRRNGIAFDSRLSFSEFEPGIRVEPTGVPHLQAGSAWFSGSPAPSAIEAFVDWRDFAITVYAQCDDPIKGVYPEDPEAAENDQVSILTLRFGGRAKYDLLTAGTILDVSADGTPTRAQSSGLVRDDSQWLDNVARMAWLWYSIDRVSFSLSYKQISGLFFLGDLIVQIGSLATQRVVNSIITEIDWDFEEGTTTLTTSYGKQLDLVGLV